MEGMDAIDATEQERRGGSLALHEEVIARFRNSVAPEHQRLCAVVGAIAQVLNEQGLPFSATAYFAATMSSLERQCSGDIAADDPVITALCTFLAMVLPKTPFSVLKSKGCASLTLLVALSGNDTVPSGALKSALSCIALLLRAVDKSDWPSIAPAFNILAKHCLDRRPKVRKRAHECTAQVLSQLQGSQSLNLASESFVSLFEQSLVAVSGRNGATSAKKDKAGSESTGALEVLHILNALKLILPIMAGKSIGKGLGHLSTLLELQQPLLTREVLNTMQALFMAYTADIPAKSLTDVVGKLAALLTPNRKAADESTATARILIYGMERLHAVDRDACALKLSAVFHSVAGLLTSEQEEAMFGAAECLRSLIEKCIDETMIQQGLNRSKLVRESWSLRPTPIEKVCAVADSVLGYQYSGAWGLSLQVISALFVQIGEGSAVLMAGIVKTLTDLQRLSDENMTCRKQLHKTFGAAVAAMGPDQFLTLLPLEMDSEDLSKSQLWLLPILKQNIVGAELKYFAENILPLAHRLRESAQKYVADGRMVAARKFESCMQALWALLPSFCNYPQDTDESFRLIAKALGDALSKETELRGIICHSLQILIKQNKEACGNIASPSSDKFGEESVVNKTAEEKAKARYTRFVASANLIAIGSFSRNFLPLLFNIFISSPLEKRGDLQATIEDFASISDKTTIRDFFIAIMQKLLKATKHVSQNLRPKGYTPMEIVGPNKEETATSRRCVFMDLALSLLHGLDEESVAMLFTATKPAIQDVEGSVQKKGYKVLASLCKEHAGLLAGRSDEILELLLAAMPLCHLSAKRHRLNCLLYLVLHVFKSNEPMSEVVLSSFISEVILATKESNSKTRNTAYDLLVQVAHSLDDNDSGVSKGKILQLFHMIVGCLAGTTPHMISAAVTGLARLIYEFPDLCHMIPDLMPSALLLLQSKSREVIKSVLGFIKVAAARQPAVDLQQHLGSMTEGLLLWSGDSKNHFKAKVRVILEMLVRRCGVHAVSAVMPEQHMKLLTDIRKKKERKDRRKSGLEGNRLEESKSARSLASTTRHSKWNHTQFFSDVGLDDDGDDDSLDYGNSTLSRNTAVTKSRATIKRLGRKRKSARRLLEDSSVGGSEPLDLLDENKTRTALSIGSTRKVESRNDDFEIALDGRMIIPETGHDDGGSLKRRRRLEENDRDSDSRSVRSKNNVASLQFQRKTHKVEKTKRMRGLPNKKKKLETGWAYTGDEYSNKKGSSQGDIKQKGKLEPYAYWPLDPKMLNRREEKQATARQGLASVLKLTKKMQGMSVVKALNLKSKVHKSKHKVHKGKNKGKEKSK